MNDDQNNVGIGVLMEEGLVESRTIHINDKTMVVRVESSYWRAIDDICDREQMSVAELLNDICNRLHDHLPARNRRGLSVSSITIGNAIRVFVVGYFRQAATEVGHLRAGHGQGNLFSLPTINL